MGLDSILVNNSRFPFENVDIDPPLRLCGGMLSGNGSGSFRGKVYNDVVEYVTGVSLYQELIAADVVKQMADKLEAKTFVQLKNIFDVNEQEWINLQRMFRAYADRGACLAGWW